MKLTDLYCNIGIHKWSYFKLENITFIPEWKSQKPYTKKLFTNRICEHCSEQQYLNKVTCSGSLFHKTWSECIEKNEEIDSSGIRGHIKNEKCKN